MENEELRSYATGWRSTFLRRSLIALLVVSTMIQLFANVEYEGLRERIHVQTDKKVYLAGEQIRMKLLTVDAEHLPLRLSTVAYTELVDDSVGHIQTIVALTSGIGESQMQLPADMPSGFYRLIAYTQLMRNEGAAIFFETVVGVINPFQQDYYPQFVEAETSNTPIAQQQNPSGSITLQTNKPVYTTREHGELFIAGLPENMHTLSVTIAGEDLIDLHSDGETATIHGKRFSLVDKSTESSPDNRKYLPEFEGHILTGRIVDNQTGQLVSEPNLKTGLTFPGEGLHYFPGQPTESGEIRFITAGIAGTENIATIVYDSDDKYRVDIVSPFVSHFTPKAMPALSIDTSRYQQLLARSVAMQASHYFSDNSSAKRVVGESIYKIKPTNSYLLDEYTRFPTMREVFIEFISNARFERQYDKWALSVVVNTDINSYYGAKSLVLLDGVHISNHEFILNYNPALIKQINIYTKRCNFGGELFDGIVELFSYPEHMQDVDFGKSIQIIPYKLPQIFDPSPVPDYTNEANRNNWMPDTRHTLLWEPAVRTAGQTTLRIPFDTSDLKGAYQVTVEGVTFDGAFVNTTTAFSVGEF